MLTLIGLVAAAVAFSVIANWRLHLFKLEILDEVAKLVPQRARDEQGRFVGDNPTTMPNEAYVGGVAPKKTGSTRRSSRK